METPAATSDPWTSGTLYDTTDKAQAAFDASPRVRAAETAEEYHDAVASAADRARVNAIRGDHVQVCAWYWEDALR
jgi:hypothetical protein